MRATKIPPSLGDDLVCKLALLQGAPPGIAESTLVLLGPETRSLLTAEGILRTSDTGLFAISDYGWDVIAACYARYRDVSLRRRFARRLIGIPGPYSGWRRPLQAIGYWIVRKDEAS